MNYNDRFTYGASQGIKDGIFIFFLPILLPFMILKGLAQVVKWCMEGFFKVVLWGLLLPFKILKSIVSW